MSRIARFVTSGFQRQFVFSALDGRSSMSLIIGLRFEGPLDQRALERALRQLVARHETLRTTLSLGDPPEQRVAAEQPLELERIVLASAGDAHAAALDLMAERVAQPFQLHGEPLVRAALAQLGPHDHVLTLVVHHVLVDGWSMRLIARDLTTLYRAAVEGTDPMLPTIELGMADYATWEQESRHEHVGWWCQMLGDRDLHGSIGPPHPLTPIKPTMEVHERTLAAAATVERLQTFVARSQLTMSSTLMAALGTALTSWDARDVVIGLLVANREHPGLRSTAGCLVDVLPVRVDMSGDPTFAELAERFHTATRTAYAHRIPFAALHRALGNDGPWHAARVIDVVVNYLPVRAGSGRGRPPGENASTPISELILSPGRYPWDMDREPCQPASFDLTVESDGEALRGSLNVEPTWLPEARQLALEEMLIAVLERAAIRPDARIGQLIAGV